MNVTQDEASSTLGAKNPYSPLVGLFPFVLAGMSSLD